MVHLLWWVVQSRERVCLNGDIKKNKLREAPSSVLSLPSSNNWEQRESGRESAEESGAGFPVPFQFGEFCVGLVASHMVVNVIMSI